MKLKYIPIAALVLASCQSMHSDDPSSMSFRMPEGSTLTLNKDLEITEGNTHALLQHGKLITTAQRNDYYINCRFDVRSFGPRTIKPEVFRIRRTEDGQQRASDAGIFRYYSDIFLDSDKGTDVIKLTCQLWGFSNERNFTVTEMEPTLGDYFTFTFPQSTAVK
jgi:hypothetical protein